MAYRMTKDIGNCSHYQCPFSENTMEGYKCVDIEWEGTTGFCENGQGCLTVCPHSWQPKTEKARRAKALRTTFGGGGAVLVR